MKQFSQDCLLSSKQQTIGFVPTMGDLHDGHLSLVKKSLDHSDKTVVSIFLNPKQFDNKKDYDSYKIDKDRDCSLLKKMGVDVIFIPSVETIYPKNFSLSMDVGSLSQQLCGQFRKNHFSSVCLIVNILLNIVSPNHLYLGEKDYQQFLIIKKMIKDLIMNIQVISVPTVREHNGLAMSSRNRRLSFQQKQDSSIIFETLQKMKEMILNGISCVKTIEQWGKDRFNSVPSLRLQYLSCVNTLTLEPLKTISKRCLIALAVFCHDIRLIDNIFVQRS